MVQRELLKLDSVSYSYEEERVAIKDVSVAIHTGERIAVLGNNGAGKSTFFLCCNGVLKPDYGTLFLNDEKVTKARKDIMELRRSVGLVFQEADVQILAGTVKAEISFGPMNLKLPKDEVLQRTEEAMEILDLMEYENRAPQYLSGGEKKRVTLADIVAMRPQLMLLDEPASSLDPQNRKILEKHLETLHEDGIALMIATHDVDFAWRWADRILVFSEGKLQKDATPMEVFSDDGLLERCGLEQPLLYQVAKIIGMDFIPKTVKGFTKK
ncbi:MAG: energy-coupling factor ABC transporter ATP-binding protein [Lachnospiraceae bacterium]